MWEKVTPALPLAANSGQYFGTEASTSSSRRSTLTMEQAVLDHEDDP
jgi:hypothetical protein